jgi:threonine dehydratase
VGTDLSPARIAAAVERIDPVFLHTPQFVSDDLSAALGREVVIKNETATPIGSFKGRGAWLVGDRLDPARTWVCSTAGNFGQGLAYAARARGGTVEAFVSADVPTEKISGMRALGAVVHTSGRPEQSAREHAAASDGRLHVVDGLYPEIAEGAGTIAESLARVMALVDEIVVVDDDDLRSAQQLVLETLDIPVEPAGAAGVAALVRHGPSMPPGRTAILLTGAGTT